MSSVSRSPQTTSQGDAFFVNLSTFVPSQHTLDASGNPVEVAGIKYNITYAVGALFLRDMGKTIRVPGQTIDAVWNGNQRVLRKVQVVGQGTTGPFPVTNTFIGFNSGVSGAQDVSMTPGYATFYIDMSGSAAYGCNFARLSMQ